MHKNMMFHGIGKSRGFITTIVIIVIALAILGFFGYNVADIANSPTVQNNLNYAWSLVKYVWQNYLQVPAVWIWEKIVIGLGWDSLMKLINANKSVSDGQNVVLAFAMTEQSLGLQN